MYELLLALCIRWRIYNRDYGRMLEGLTPEQAAVVKYNLDVYRHAMRDNGGFFVSLWTMRNYHA